MKRIILLAYFLSFGLVIQAQNCHSGSVIRVGFGANYYFGNPSNEMTWQPDNLGYQLDVMAGYRFSEKNSAPVVMGVFGRMGILSDKMVNQLLREGGLGIEADASTQNEFYEVEVGMILLKFLRLSTGLGFQHYRLPEGSLQNLQYRNSTVGIQIHTRSLKWEINATALHDKELTDNILRFSGVLGFEF